MASRTLLIPTVLSDEQAGRRDLVVAAATELAEAGGYDAVVMKAVADRSGVALATIYRWFASKDHLLTEVLLVWGAAALRVARRRPATRRRRRRPGRRGARAASSTSPGPARASPSAVVEAVLSVERGPLDAQGDFHQLMTSWIDAALGDDEVADRDAVTEVLEHVCFSTIIGFATGRQDARLREGPARQRGALLLLR